MSALNEFSETVAFARDNPKLTGKIEAVMLHVRARELLKQRRLHIFYSVSLSWLVGLVLEVVRLVCYPFTNTLKFFLCAVCASGWWVLADALHKEATTASILLTYFIAYGISDFKHVTEFFRHLLFDLADILSLSTLTKIFSTMIQSGGEKGCELLITGPESKYMPKRISSHFYTTRQPYVREKSLADTEDMFLKLPQSASDPEAIIEACSDYWRENS